MQHEDQQERERNKTIPIDWDAVDKWFRKIHYKYGQKRTRKRMSNVIFHYLTNLFSYSFDYFHLYLLLIFVLDYY